MIGALGHDVKGLHQRHARFHHGGQLPGEDGNVRRLDLFGAEGNQRLGLFLNRFGGDALLAELDPGNGGGGGQYLTFGLSAVSIGAGPDEYRILCCHFFLDLTLDDGRISQW